MKKFKLKIAFSLITFLLVVGFCAQIFAETNNEYRVELKGLELAKGIDITSTYSRYMVSESLSWAELFIHKTNDIPAVVRLLSDNGIDCQIAGLVTCFYQG